MKRAAAIHDAFFYINDTLITNTVVNSSGVLHSVSDIFAWTAALIQGTGAIMGMTVIPIVPLSSLTNNTINLLAEKCRNINAMGIPILLRFAPEMNGNLFFNSY